MMTIPMEPIRYDRRQVTLMVKVAMYFSPEIAQRPGKNAARVAMVIAGAIPLTPAMLDFFGLRAEGEAFVWNPR